MKRNLLYILLMAVALTSCKEVGPVMFGDITGIYFNNRSTSNSLTDSVDVTFVYNKGDVMEVPVKLQLLGRVADRDRTVSLTVSSENAVEGTDYELSGEPVLKAGETSVTYVVRLKRTPVLETSVKTLELRLQENEDFSLPLHEIAQAGRPVSTLVFRISFSDMFTKAPLAWDEGLLGRFSLAKFELICRVMDIDPADFNDHSKMTLPRMLYINNEMTAYVKGQNALKEAGKEYDTAIIDPGTGLPFVFS